MVVSALDSRWCELLLLLIGCLFGGLFLLVCFVMLMVDYWCCLVF